MSNPKERVLLNGEIEPREDVEVFSQNGETGIAFLHDEHATRKGWDSQVRVSRLDDLGWYEDGMQRSEAESALSQKC